MISIKLGNAVILPDRHVPNPFVLASYQGHHEIMEYFTKASDRIKYLEALLDSKGIEYEKSPETVLPELTGPTT